MVEFSYTHEGGTHPPQPHAAKHLGYGTASALTFRHRIEGGHESDEHRICKNRTKGQIIIGALPSANVTVWTTDR